MSRPHKTKVQYCCDVCRLLWWESPSHSPIKCPNCGVPVDDDFAEEDR